MQEAHSSDPKLLLIEGRTIENCFIEQRIENARELLIYGQMTLSEIALELEYGSTRQCSTK